MTTDKAGSAGLGTRHALKIGRAIEAIEEACEALRAGAGMTEETPDLLVVMAAHGLLKAVFEDEVTADRQSHIRALLKMQPRPEELRTLAGDGPEAA